MSTEIVRYQSLAELQTIAQTFAMTGYFDAKGSGPVEVAKTLTKILAGQEIGVGPFASMKGIYVIQGQTSFSGHLIAAGIKDSGKYDYRIREWTDAICKIEFFERTSKGMESLGFNVFTAEDAKRAGTQNMAKFPKAMLFNRCISAGYRAFCPDALGKSGPVYTPEELGAEVNEAGDYVESTARQVDANTGEILEPSQAAPEQPSGTLRKHFHATGTELYGSDGWDDKRHELVRKLTKGRTASSEDLTADEMRRLIDGMAKKIAEAEAQQQELVPADGNGGAAYK